MGGPSDPDQNDLKTKYMTEAVLYRLIARSKMPFANHFQDWGRGRGPAQYQKDWVLQYSKNTHCTASGRWLA